MQNSQDRTLALGGVFQAVSLVQSIAYSGNADATAFEASVRSVFQTDAEDVDAVYGARNGVRLGLQMLHRQIRGSKESRDIELAKYVVALLYLERKLKRNQSLLSRVRDGIEHAAQQATHFGMLHANVLASLAETYVQTISTLKPRILVNGEHVHLSNQDNANRIRTLLLAGIRSIVLWRQCGGKRWQLIFGQKAIGRDAARLLGALETAPRSEDSSLS